MPPIIDPKLCIACDRCVNICTEDVFYGSTKNEIPEVTYPRECVHFNGCVDACPVPGAIWLRVPMSSMVVYRESPEYAKPQGDPHTRSLPD
jgi:NAD-dependent dihydropyrimidine dehydrogenase PreA subunit